MFAGEKINITENRAVLHTALARRRATARLMLDGEDDHARDVHAVLDAMAQASPTRFAAGSAAGATGKKITDIVNIGIGGSDLGPAMATLALAPWSRTGRARTSSPMSMARISTTR